MVSRHPVVHILLVEDNSADVRLFRQALLETHTPHRLSIADDGEDALDYLLKRGARASAEIPDLIILDLNLPRKNGFEVLREIRSTNEIKRIPVVILSSSGNQEDVNKAYECGANMYLLKRRSLEGIEDLVRFIATTWVETVALPGAVA
jgi:chemotaxis family two-component system response regulator Rcp1